MLIAKRIWTCHMEFALYKLIINIIIIIIIIIVIVIIIIVIVIDAP